MINSSAKDISQPTDARFHQLSHWLTQEIPGSFTLSPASSDASFRRYFRVHQDNKTWIAMDAPPDKESCLPFIRISQLFQDAGLHVPQVFSQDLTQGFLLLNDLGTTTYLQALQQDRGLADQLMSAATHALISWQRASTAGILPPYDATLLERELKLFPEWYLQKHLGLTFTPAQQVDWQKACVLLIDNALEQAQVFVHRDYMPRNLMVSTPNPGILDFQDAVYGPISYDVISLFRDAFISWDEEQSLDWIIRYWERARLVGLPVDADFAEFYRQCEWMGAQRHLKVLGIFARIAYRDGKPKYLEDAPRFINYLEKITARYRTLKPLRQCLESCGVFEAGSSQYSF